MHSAIYQVIHRKAVNSVFQPIIDLTASEIDGYEALVRGPSHSSLYNPKALFEAAIQFDLVVDLEFLCIESACKGFKENQLEGSLFINISPMSLIKYNGQERLVEILNEYGFTNNSVVIELSEQYPLDDYELLGNAIKFIRDNGFQLAIDDLGAGYSSLRVWSEFNPEYVKIDRHFIDGINKDSVKYDFVRAIQEISRSLACKVIAEGIETEEELKSIGTLGITHVQGYLLGKPRKDPVRHIDNVLFESINPLRHVVYHRHKDTVGDLMEECSPILLNTRMEAVADEMQRQALVNCLPIINNNEPVGVITRKKIFEIFLGRYGRELHAKKPVRKFLSKQVLIVDKSCTLSDVSKMFTASNQLDMNVDIIITDNGNYAGVLKTKRLLEKITEHQIMSARHSNPLTLLPGNVPIYEWIDDLLDRRQSFKFAYFDLNNFKPYNDIYGYSKGDEIIVLLSDILKAHLDTDLDRVGHIGGDDFVALFQSRDWQFRCNAILETFADRIRDFYNDEDLSNQGIYSNDRRGKRQFFPLLSVAIGVVDPDWQYCRSHHDVASIAADAKHEAKKEDGNSLFLSRRRAPVHNDQLENFQSYAS